MINKKTKDSRYARKRDNRNLSFFKRNWNIKKFIKHLNSKQIFKVVKHLNMNTAYNSIAYMFMWVK